MRQSEVLAAQVSGSCRSRGREYFLSGAVRDVRFENDLIVATVRGGAAYSVALAPTNGALGVTCSCPYFADRFEPCKHIWATILAAESQGLPLVPAGHAAGTVILRPFDRDDDEDDVGFGDDLFENNTAEGRAWAPSIRTVAPRHGARPQPGPTPPWRKLLNAVGAAQEPASPVRPQLAAGQLIYVIDVAATLSAGVLVVELMTRDAKANGDWAKPKAAHVSDADIRSLPHGDDREILERLRGARAQLDYAGYYENDFGHELSRLRLAGVLATDMLPRLCGAGRAFARIPAPSPAARSQSTGWDSYRKPDPPILVPVAWDAGAAWRFEMAIRRDDANAAYTIEGSLNRDGMAMAVTEPLVVLADGLLLTRSHVARLDHGGAFAWLAAMRRVGSVAVPYASRSAIMSALLAHHSPPLSHVPDELRIEIVDGVPKPRLRLLPTPRPDRMATELSFDYDGLQIAAESTTALAHIVGSNRAVRRSLTDERRHAATLQRIGCRLEWQYGGGQALQLPTTHVPRAARTLLAEGWHVEAAGRVYRQPGAANLSVSSGIDWFDLEGTVDYGGATAALPQLLEALERGESYVGLSDGSLGLVPDEWLRKQSVIARLGTADGDRIRFKPSQVALLDALLEAQPQATWDDAFARARNEVQRFDGIRPIDPPATFAGTLRDYQRQGLGWLTFLEQFGFGGCLADDMGLGKTVMVLALLDQRRDAQPADDRRPSLVVAPRSVVFNWMREAERFTPRLRVIDYTGSGRASIVDRLGDADIVLTTYGTLRRDAPALSARAFDYVVLDESQAIKNAATASAKAARLLNARFRLALSGTPIENHLGELGSLFEFLNPGMFGRSAFALTPGEEDLALLSRGLRPFILRRTKEQVASELPPKVEQTLYCELEKPQRALYNELRDHYRRTLLDDVGPGALKRNRIQVLEALLRLRQAACHPGLIDAKRSGAGSAKLDLLLPRLRETVDEGHKALVFSQFTKFLAIVRRELDAQQIRYEYLDGRTRHRDACIDRFQTDPACPLFLISLKAGGVGLNLTAADSVFLLDPWWNPATEAQAIDRTHRIGQTRHVFAYRLIAGDTVEERVLELQQRKRRLADAILSASAAPLTDLKREDLELLLS